jgi:3-oxoacyl-[acyl-carrier-protein] synthase II
VKKRVVITGIGAVTPLGIGIEENWQKIKDGYQGMSTLEFPGSNTFPHSFCGSVRNFDPSDFISQRKMIKLMNREARMAVSAAGLAIHDAGLEGHYSPYRTGLYMGTGLTSGELADLIRLVENSIDENNRFSYQRLGTEALPNCNPLLSFRILTNMPLCYISILFQVKGPNLVFNPWSSHTAQAIGEGMFAIKQGEIDCAIVGGCDSKSHYTGFLTFTKLGLLSKKGMSRPFDKERDGIVLSEGACILILEDLEKAESRGAKIYAELSGYATVTDPDSKTLFSNNPAVLEKAMKQAISDADLDEDDIDLVCAAANSHPVGDLAEARAIESLFKKGIGTPNPFTVSQMPFFRSFISKVCRKNKVSEGIKKKRRPYVHAVKALTGDMVAAAAPFQLAVCAMALKEKILPPQVNLEEFEKNVRRQPCKNDPGTKDMEAALSNSFELGNSKVSLVARRYS